ncbi:MAG: hypothetical protein QOK48_3139 [Blastocatellia bacterium]|jgi:hypothetical protein|nr:hypothetical protein [Blastocatellia bacterium]
MGTILSNLNKVHVAVVLDKFKHGEDKAEFAKDLAAAAIDAIMGGVHSDAWKLYMSLFADNEAQLALLTEPKDQEPSYLPTARAYIVANAVCGAGTTGQTAETVGPTVDCNLLSDVSPTFKKDFNIPHDLQVPEEA